MAKVWSKNEIVELIDNNDKMVMRSVFQLWQRQTITEQAAQETSAKNGIGFNGVDAPFLSSCAEFYQRTGFLTQRQIASCRRKIRKYSGQLVKIANGEI